MCINCPSDCPYLNCDEDCNVVLINDAIACIKHFADHFRDLTKKVEQLERERDAAVEAMFLKPLSWDEAMSDDAFLEVKDDECIDAALNLFACCVRDGSVKDGFVYYETHNTNELKLLEIDYGKTWRCWARRPTDEERAAAVWEVE